MQNIPEWRYRVLDGYGLTSYLWWENSHVPQPEKNLKVAFDNDASFAFEFVRNLGFMYYGGSDLGEMIATAGLIKEGDEESWFTEFDNLARRLLSRADASLAAGHLESARGAYLRASTYFRTAEFYLHGNPGDPRILSESRASQKAYAEAAKLTGPTWDQCPLCGKSVLDGDGFTRAINAAAIDGFSRSGTALLSSKPASARKKVPMSARGFPLPRSRPFIFEISRGLLPPHLQV
jgi:hypothetical protein